MNRVGDERGRRRGGRDRVGDERGRRRGGRGRVRRAALALAFVVAGTGCAGARISLGTGASACFRALPAAQTAVHHKGRLVGVRRVNSATFGSRLPRSTSVASTLPAEDVCVFAFDGSYPPGSVSGASNSTPGRYAIVVVGYKHPLVVAAFAVDRLPTRFRHLR